MDPLQNTGETPTIDHKAVIMQQTAADLQRVEFGTFRKPEMVADEAAHVARIFQAKLDTVKDPAGVPILYRMFGPSRHITRPGWQLLGAMWRVTAGVVPGTVVHVEYGENDGFEATAEAIYVPTGARISTAVSMCLTDEDNWNMRPEYDWKPNPKGGKDVRTKVGDRRVPLFQLASMAQTRACSKVLSNLLSFVANMAGCSGTAAEEMQESGQQTTGQPAATSAASPGPQRTPQSNGALISEAQVGRLFSLIKQSGRSRDALGVILAAHGYTAPSNAADPVEEAAILVKRADFDKIQDAILKPEAK